MLQTLDVLHAGLKNGALVRPRVAHHLEERVGVLRQQSAQLLDAIIDVEAPTPLNCEGEEEEDEELELMNECHIESCLDNYY